MTARTTSMETGPQADSRAPEKGRTAPLRILLVAPSPPPYGGMAIQARLLEKFLRNDGHLVDFFPSNCSFPRWLRPLEQVGYVRTVIRTLLITVTLAARVRRAEVIHIFAASWVYFFAVVCPAVLYGCIRGTRIVLNYRSGDGKEFFRYFGWLVKPVFRLADVCTAPSEFLAQAIRERFGVAVRVIPNILDHSTFVYRHRTDIRPKILVTRHLEKIYGVDVVVRAFQMVQSRYPDASLWIAGTGSEEQNLRGMVSAWNLRNVRFLGYVAHSDLAAIYEQCDILLNGSFVDNFPGALLEASGAGLVVVSTGAGGIPFMFQDGKNALLVEPGDWNGLARAVEMVLQSPPLGAALAKHAAAMVQRCQWPELRSLIYGSYGYQLEVN
jgi:L-malate glycosyltransferase